MATSTSTAEPGPIRILFLGHASTHHNSGEYYPMLAQAFGKEGIYFDYQTEVARALDPEYLNQFDGLLLYANHDRITGEQMQTLLDYVESGHGFIPVHSASACFGNEPRFISLVGARFQRHGAGEFTAKITNAGHPAMKDVVEFESWDESYVHNRHNEENRTVLMMREDEPWTWVRTQGEGRVFYTASGHDERTWSRPEFQQLLKSGILWAVGDEARSEYDAFIASRAPRHLEPRPTVQNYERRPEPLPFQFPLAPEDSMAYTQVPVDFELELFAAEPMIINPIALAWDERGRLWVAETVNYPSDFTEQGQGDDSIKILEDTDGNGRADKVTVFADGLNIVTSLVLVDGGVLVAQAPDFIFFKDTDGDDVADVRNVVLSGWGKGDTHAGPSNLRYGLDNWVYGTVGYSRFRGTVNGRDHDFAQGVFRMKADGSDIEFLHQFSNNTWGLGFNAAGDVFGSTANGAPSFFGGIPQTNYPEGMRGGMSAKMIADSRRFYPLTPDIRQVDWQGQYTAAAGHAIATGNGVPPEYRDTIAFVTEPTGNLTGMFKLERDGSGYAAKNAFSFIASADDWFSPVAQEVGPDGAVWIADFYNFIIQHNPTPSVRSGGFDTENGQGGAHVNPLRDHEHGRIYRAVWKNAPEPAIRSLAGADTATLVAALDNDNQFWRLTAQRLLVQNGSQDAVPALKAKVTSEGGIDAVHALWTLDGLDALDRDTLQTALLSTDPALRRNGVRALGTDEEALQLFFDTAVATDDDLLVRLEAFNHIAKFPKSDTLKRAVNELLKDPVNTSDEWLNLALQIAVEVQDAGLKYTYGPNLLPNASFEELDANGMPVGWTAQINSGAPEFSVDTENATEGERSAKITAAEAAAASFSAKVAVKPETTYRIAGSFMTQRIAGDQGARGARGGNARGRGGRGGLSAYLSIEGMSQEDGATEMPGGGRGGRGGGGRGFGGTPTWQEVERIITTGSGQTEAQINAQFGGFGGTSTGSANFDNLYFGEATLVVEGAVGPEGGDLARGETLFKEHALVACARCHKVGGEGGDVGPALDGIASKKDHDYLYQSLIDPSATMAEGYQLEMSPMPPMNLLLSDQEIADVMAYLGSLK